MKLSPAASSTPVYKGKPYKHPSVLLLVKFGTGSHKIQNFKTHMGALYDVLAVWIYIFTVTHQTIVPNDTSWGSRTTRGIGNCADWCSHMHKHMAYILNCASNSCNFLLAVWTSVVKKVPQIFNVTSRTGERRRDNLDNITVKTFPFWTTLLKLFCCSIAPFLLDWSQWYGAEYIYIFGNMALSSIMDNIGNMRDDVIRSLL